VVADKSRADVVAAGFAGGGETVTQLGTIVPSPGDGARVRFSGHLDLAW
jgi:hypothetical protein